MRKDDDETEIELGEYTGLHRKYDYLPYTVPRINRYLKEQGFELENIWQGYKANRRPGYREIYRIIRKDTGEVINPCVNYEQLRRMLANLDVPLYDEKSMAGRSKDATGRNPNAVRFLETVEYIDGSQKKS